MSTDAALAARILKVANSALHRGNHEIENLQQAVSRLGNNLVSTLVTSHALTQFFTKTSAKTQGLFRQLHRRSLEVAIYAYALANQQAHINHDDALLAGLIHDISYLPILEQLQDQSANTFDLNKADTEILMLKSILGEKILNSWHFPANLVGVVRDFEFIERDTSAEADLVYIIIVAHLNALRNTSHIHTLRDWHQLAAFSKLGIDPDEPLLRTERLYEDIIHARAMLGV